MTLTNRTDSDRLDQLVEAAEKQTAAINRLAMAVQEAGEEKPQPFSFWRLVAAIAAVLFIVASIASVAIGETAHYPVMVGGGIMVALYVLARSA